MMGWEVGCPVSRGFVTLDTGNGLEDGISISYATEAIRGLRYCSTIHENHVTH